jgi:hypothetical protein
MQGYLGPYTSHQTNMSLTPCDYIYLVEAKFSKCDPRISRIVSIPMLLLIITITTIYASDGGNHRFAFQSNLVIATNVIVKDCFQSVID